jgi:replicative DNA helicase
MTIQMMDAKSRGKMARFTPEEIAAIKKAHAEIKKYPLEIVYATMNCHQLRLRMRRFALQNPDKHLVVVLDHLGLVQGDTADMRVNTIIASGVLKSFCVDYAATVINLTQFTKSADAPENKKIYYRPSMNFIMESGRVRQDSDIVILLWRPEIWFPFINYKGDENWETMGKMVWLVEKNRDGFAPCDIILGCNIGTNKLNNSAEVFG